MKTLQLYKQLLLLITCLLCTSTTHTMKRGNSNELTTAHKKQKISCDRIQKKFENLFNKKYTPTDSIFTPQDLVTIECYLQQGADPNTSIPLTNTQGLNPCELIPLVMACNRQQKDLLSLLLKYNADPNQTCNDLTPLCYLCSPRVQFDDTSLSYSISPVSNQEYPTRKQLITMLLKHDANINGAYTPDMSDSYSYLAPIFYSEMMTQKNISALLIKNGTHLFPDTEEDTKHFVALRQETQNQLSLAMFYNTAPESSLFPECFPKDIINYIAILYGAIHFTERTQNWKDVCDAVYPEYSLHALIALPFMTKKEQLKVCKAYYLGKTRTFALTK